MFIQSFDKSIRQSLENFKDLILVMSNGNSITFLDESMQVPIGCAMTTLSDKCKLYLMLKGIIDIDKEEQKMTKKKEKLKQEIESLKKLMASDNYETRVPEAVRQKNQEKVTCLFLAILNSFNIS